MFRKKQKPIPPGHHISLAEHHWLKMYDGDDHFLGYIVLQWQPGVKKWCISGNVATGNDIEWGKIEYWEYFCLCPIPDDDSNLVKLAQDKMNKDITNPLRQSLLKENDLL